MSSDVEQIAEDLLKLPSSSRAKLAERLLESIEDFTTPDVEQAWKVEVAKRIEEYESGVVQGIPAEDVFNATRKRLLERKIVAEKLLAVHGASKPDIRSSPCGLDFDPCGSAKAIAGIHV